MIGCTSNSALIVSALFLANGTMPYLSLLEWIYHYYPHRTSVRVQGFPCVTDVWFDGFPYTINPGRPEWSKVQTREGPLVATAQAKYVSAGEQ